MGMEYYGNKTWNNATDNKDKSVVPLREESLQKILPVLEQSGLNFYAYVKDGTIKETTVNGKLKYTWVGKKKNKATTNPMPKVSGNVNQAYALKQWQLYNQTK